jgi:hypothetical protein
MDLKAEDIVVDHRVEIIKRHDGFNDRVLPDRIHIVKLNRELLPTEKSTKEKVLVFSESWVCHDIDLKHWEK